MRLSKRITRAIVTASVAALAMSSTASAATTVVVRDSALNGWTPLSSNCAAAAPTGSQAMETGPGTPPQPVGSREFRVGASSQSAETFGSSAYQFVYMQTLSELRYHTYVEPRTGQTNQAPYLTIAVDVDGDNFGEDVLLFEPGSQNDTGDAFPDQGDVRTARWQGWNAMTGAWSSPLATSVTGQAFLSLNDYRMLFPSARIVNQPLPGIQVGVGCRESDWVGFIGNVDNVRIGISGDTTTYNFEPGAPAAGPPRARDCKNGGWQNYTRADGSPFTSERDCKRYVRSLTS